MDLCNINDIRELLSRHGFKFSRSMGQNFLTAPWVPERIAEGAGIDSTFGVLEIGPGIGCLTEQLCRRAGKVVSVELDKTLIPVLRETTAKLDNFELVPGDILKLDVGKTVDEKLAGLRHAVCANLPYNITTPVLTALIDSGRFESVTVMVQREVARRMCARPGTADYGAFTVYVNYHTRPEILFDVSPGCFVPQPKVYSSVIKLETRTSPPVEDVDEDMFFKVVKASFAQRRKMLVNGLCSAFGSRLGKQQILQVIESCGFDERIRGEMLDIPGFAAVAAELKRVIGCG